MNRDRAYLADIRNACRNIVEFTPRGGEMAFYSRLVRVLAVLHEFIVIGEAVKRLSEGFRNGHPEVPWRDVADMRNKMVHEYDTVDDAVVWVIAVRDIPDLLRHVQSYLDS